MTARNSLMMWTIYDHPKDHPDCFVARLWFVTSDGPMPTDAIMLNADLEVLRVQLERHGLYCLKRFSDDDPKIVEVWL